MSTAHRPTWDPAQARDVKGGSRQFSVRDMAAHTKLKFRQPGQTSVNEVQKRDLRAELLLAEEEAQNKKRKAEGKPPLAIAGGEDEEANKRRKLLQETLEMDKDDEDDEDEEEDGDEKKENGKNEGKNDDDESGEGSDDEDDDEDETAELLRELEKIKRERAEEKARQELEQSTSQQASREAEIATANPLLNLAAALGQGPGVDTTVPGTFSVKKRWDDDLIFKNQAMSQRDKPQGRFVNDLLRTEFHRKFMSKFIK
ncbi:Cwf15 Cwc15 cell cycle control protein [Coniophora puteana RWD-64-598 SS2]|uniref:Cwf15 Cwc15 cell cycle control protein n=1 Tax=Coniophora puteana (strain RWD-64-598) TaxID=741705 RepID=A0A5M3MMK6_CONPW|nr:Cwf15 Cwc15 cell cycle control protein [Coniophora puteana RWD-64-598 SS2]EIW80408.1 Cwf15 Cwc15 cell cycle control protein [Coniophora puteana RWD-64-598 SS2]